MCGRLDDAGAIQPLFVVTGASGSGKTAVFPPLARLLAGRCITFDIDSLLDAAGAVGGMNAMAWPAFRDAWLSVAHGVAQSGPLTPEHLEGLPARRWIGNIHYLVPDCSDEVRRARIAGRLTWRRPDIDEQTRFANWLRHSIAEHVDTSHETPEATANAVAAWVAHNL